jgi:hypothetical protein
MRVLTTIVGLRKCTATACVAGAIAASADTASTPIKNVPKMILVRI